MKETEYCLPEAIKAAVEAGREIMSIYNDPLSDFGVEAKSDDSPLTIADRKAHEIISGILSLTPYPVLSEEGAAVPYDIRSEWERLWIVDPLDGTKEFIKKNGEFTVNIALVDKGIPVAGVIYVPATGVLYFGSDVGGAWKISGIADHEPIPCISELREAGSRLPERNENRNYTVVASRSHLSPETEEFIAKIKGKHPDAVTATSGSSLKICLVAEGRADVYPRFGPTMEWDTAAGDAIAQAAGARVYRPEDGTPLRYNKPDLLNPWFIVEASQRH